MKKFINEIKNRVYLIISNWLIVTFVCYFYKDVLIFILIKPITQLSENNSLYFIFTNLTEIFEAQLYLIIFFSNQIIFFYIIYNILKFISPGLYKSEYLKIKQFLSWSFFTWMLSTYFFYILLLPKTWEFFFSYQSTIFDDSFNLYLEAKLNEYFKFFNNVYFISKTSSQLIFMSIFFVNLQDNFLNFIKSKKKLIYFFNFLIATLITPPDIISQITVGSLLILLYEFFMLILIIKKYYFKQATS